MSFGSKRFSGTPRSDFDGAMKTAANILNARPMSCGELTSRLKEKGFTEDCAAAVTDKLKELRLLDDAEYAASVVRHYISRGYGPRKVKDELKRRLVPEDEALAALDNAEWDADMIEKLLIAKLGDADISDKKAVNRAVSALMRRGFEWKDIAGAVSHVTGEYTE